MLHLRRVRKDDCRLLWEWANDPEVRAFSFSSEPIPWEEHIRWFQSKLNEADCIFYIAMDSDMIPIGQVRYDIDRNEALISVSIDRKFRSKGYGSQTIRLASKRLLSIANVKVLHAYVKPNNGAAMRAFVKAGFQKGVTTAVRGHEAVHFALRGDAL